jgi:hypothetical protein
MIYKKVYYETDKGIPLSNLWDDIYPDRKTQFPTAKPEELFRRIFSLVDPLTSEKRVLDCFVGSGNSMVYAQKKGWLFTGFDNNYNIAETAARQVGLSLPGNSDEKKVLIEQDHLSFERDIRERMNAIKEKDEGIDGITRITNNAIQIKHRDNMGRNEIHALVGSMTPRKLKKGALVAKSFNSTAQKYADEMFTVGFEIILYTVDEIIQEKHFDDKFSIRPSIQKKLVQNKPYGIFSQWMKNTSEIPKP